MLRKESGEVTLRMKNRFSTPIRVFLLICLCAALGFGQFPFGNLSTPAKPAAPAAAAVQSFTPIQVDEALTKYSACYVGTNRENLRDLNFARAVAGALAKEGFKIGGIYCNERKGGATQAGFVPEAELVKAGYPANQPSLLVIRDTDGDMHSVAELAKWMSSGGWNWGLRWCLQRVW